MKKGDIVIAPMYTAPRGIMCAYEKYSIPRNTICIIREIADEKGIWIEGYDYSYYKSHFIVLQEGY